MIGSCEFVTKLIDKAVFQNSNVFIINEVKN